ncbi:c-type cytochrome [Bradyrhizobium sp. 5.13L]
MGALSIALGGFLFAWSGVYNVAASRGHWEITNSLLTFGMRNSVRTHSIGIEVPPLDSKELVILGAAHFQNGCAFCHGAPGVPISPIAQSMLPSPPDLSKLNEEWREQDLFWIVKHGLKYTGMPAWVAAGRDDEVWALVAFLKRLPTLDAAAYRDLALGGLSVPEQSGRQIATAEDTSGAVSACARCHGEAGRGPTSKLVPVLHGQPLDFLLTAMDDYAHARRQSGIMQPLASDLSPDDRARVARYYAGLSAPDTPGTPPDQRAVERGRRLATSGDPAARIPACMECHNNSSLAAYPRLRGQNVAYMVNRLKLWKGGLNARTSSDAIMAPIARALDERQIEDVSAYFGSIAAERRTHQ